MTTYALTATGDTSGTWPVGSTLTGFAHVTFHADDPFAVIIWHWGRVGVDSGEWAQTSIGVDPSAEDSPKTMTTVITFTVSGVYDVWAEIRSHDFSEQYVELDIGVVTITAPAAPVEFPVLARTRAVARLVPSIRKET